MAHHCRRLLPPLLVTGFYPTIPWRAANVPECNPDHTPRVERERVQGLLEERPASCWSRETAAEVIWLVSAVVDIRDYGATRRLAVRHGAATHEQSGEEHSSACGLRLGGHPVMAGA